MSTDSFNAKKALLITRLIFLAMFTSILIFTVMVFTVRTGKYSFRIDSLAPFTLSPLILFCVAIPAVFLYSKKLLGKSEIYNTLRDKFFIYQRVLIMRLAVCEGVAFYSIVFLLITGNLFGVLIAAAALFVISTNFPNADKISSLLNLSPGETEEFK